MGGTKISKYNKLVGIFNNKYTHYYGFPNKSVKGSSEIESSGGICRLILVLQTVFYLPSRPIVLFLYVVGFLHYSINTQSNFHPEKLFTLRWHSHSFFFFLYNHGHVSLQLEDLSFKSVKYFICVVNFTKYNFQYCTQFLISFISFCFL